MKQSLWFRGVCAIVAGLLFVAGPAAHADPAPLRVASSTWVGYGLLHLAAKKGLFKEAGVVVDLQTIEDKASTASAIATGRIDGWATTVDTFIFYNAEKLRIKQVLAVDQSAGGEGIAAVQSIKTVKDLRGRTIAAEEGSSTYFFLLNVLNEAGLKLSDVKIQSMRAGDAGAAFFAGNVDAVATWDPWFAKNWQKAGAHKLADTKSHPGLVVDTVAFSEATLKTRKDDVARFINGYFAAYDLWQKDPEGSNKVMADALGMKLEDFKSSLSGIEFTSKEQNLRYLGSPSQPGEIVSVIERGSAMYEAAKLIKAKPNSRAVLDGGPLNAAVSR